MSIAFFLISEGEVEVKKQGKIVAILEKGQFFGEMTLLDKFPRSADVVAKVPTKCLVLTSWEFRSLVLS